MGKLGVVVHACHLSTWEVKEVTTLALKSVSPKNKRERDRDRDTETDTGGGGVARQSQERNAVKYDDKISI